MPMGVLIDCLCVLIGGTLGAKYRTRIPERFQEPLTVVFGICAMAIGIASFIRLNGLPAVILALVMGAVIGEALNLEEKSCSAKSSNGCISASRAMKRPI